MAPPTRRRFLRDTGLAGTSLALLPWLSACEDTATLRSRDAAAGPREGNDPNADVPDTDLPTPRAVVFRHGVASGDPLPDRVILWTRVSPLTAPAVSGAESQTAAAELPESIPVAWAIGMDPDLRQVLQTGRARADAARDYTVKIDPDSLAPGTTYYYQFRVGDTVSPIGRTRTAPLGGVERLRLAFTCCSDYKDGLFHAYRGMARRADLDAVLHVGDYIYESAGTSIAGRQHMPPREILSLADYRTRYAQYRADPDLQECHRQHPWICVWDDHESANDSWRDGAAAHQPDSEGTWPARRAVATQAYHEWLPIRTPDADDLTRIYRRFQFGDLVDLIVFETRLFGRDEPVDMAQPEAANDVTRTMMGFEQEGWLAGMLATSTTRWRTYANQTVFAQLRALNALARNDLVDLEPLAIPLNPDQWDGYAANRDRIFNQWIAQRLRNNILMSGDIHASLVSELSPAPGDASRYDPVTGRGSLGVEFVTPSVTSSSSPEIDPIADAIRGPNTHIKYIETASHGYVLLDIRRDRVQGEFWYVNDITQPEFGERFATAFVTEHAGENDFNAVTQTDTPTAPRTDAPTLAGKDHEPTTA